MEHSSGAFIKTDADAGKCRLPLRHFRTASLDTGHKGLMPGVNLRRAASNTDPTTHIVAIPFMLHAHLDPQTTAQLGAYVYLSSARAP